MTDMLIAPSVPDLDSLPPAGPPVPPPTEDVLAGISGFRKAAILVMQIGPEQSAKLLGSLTDRELEDLSSEIARMGKIEPTVAAAVLAEFAATIAQGSIATSGGIDNARQLLVSTIGEDRAESILDRVSEHMVDVPFSLLQHADPRQILTYVGEEHPQTIALVLAHLPAMLASQVLAGLPGEQRADVAHRIAVMDRTSPEVIRQVEASLQRRLSSVLAPKELSAVGGLVPLVEIINRADRGTEKLILEGLEQRDPSLAEEIRSRMFMFEDLVTLEDRAVQLVVRQVETAELATALKGVSEAVREKVVSNMSERAAVTLMEEIEVLGPVRLNLVESAQASVVRAIRALEEEGQITIRRGEEDELVG
jgi:flagellar motor switch protein FliG